MVDVDEKISARAGRYFQKDARVRNDFVGPDAVNHYSIGL